MRFHEQLKKPTTAAHDRAVAAVMKMPLPDVLAGFFPSWDRNSLNFVELEWFPEEPVRETHRGNLVGFIDLAALALPQAEITADVRLLATGVPLIAWDATAGVRAAQSEFAALEDAKDEFAALEEAGAPWAD